jgi:outer membrane protein TolC
MPTSPKYAGQRKSVFGAVVMSFLMASCASFEESPEWNPEASAPSSPEVSWIPPKESPATPRSLDDLLRIPALTEEKTPASQLPSKANAKKTLRRLTEMVPTSSAESPLDLPQLIEVALAKNPSTRESWQSARAAAARLGESMQPYYPEVSFETVGGALKEVEPFPLQNAIVRQVAIVPQLQISYILLDFGRRSAAADEARRMLAAANFGFNREIQRVIYEVEASFYGYDAARALEAAAKQNLELAESVRDDVGRRLELGLSTRPDFLLAKQIEARAVYDLESSKVGVNNSRAKLALSMGLPANAPLHVVALFEEPLPEELGQEVEQMIDIALGERPDLQAQVERLRASEARLAKAKADFFPVIGLEGAYGGQWWNYRISGGEGVAAGGPNEPRQESLNSIYEALVVIEWPLFEGFSRFNRVRKARAEREREKERLRALELEATNQVWSVYYDYKAAYRKYDYGVALLAASDEAYRATRESFDVGLSTIDDLLRAESDLASARYTLIGARSELLSTSARLGFALGNIQSSSPAP